MREEDSGTPAAAADLAALAQEAVVWGWPLVMMGRYLAAAREAGLRFNHFYMNTEVADAKAKSVGPNIDTLNGRAWLDLDNGPQVIGVPETDDRYYCVQLQDLYTNSFAYLGRRATGTAAGAFAITPPGWTGTLPAGVVEVPATLRKVSLMVRTLVRGPADLAAVQALNGSFTLGSLADWPAGRDAATVASGAIDAFQPATRRATGLLPHDEIAQAGAPFFDELDELVRQYPPLPNDAGNLARFAPLGIGGGDAGVRADPALQPMLAEAVRAGIKAAQNGLNTWQDNGWARRENVAPIIDDPLQRAANNFYGPNTQISAESAFYNKRKGPDGKTLSGVNRYRLRFGPGGAPPSDAFWSLTLYDNKYNLFDNPIDRYGITDRTDGLVFGADGSLDIRVQAEPPTEAGANWLPSPAGEFQLVLRSYQPRQALLDREYQPPPLEIVAG